MAQCNVGKTESGTMDSLQLEQERGITIMAKVTSTTWKGCKINLVDTPGNFFKIPRIINVHHQLRITWSATTKEVHSYVII